MTPALQTAPEPLFGTPEHDRRMTLAERLDAAVDELRTDGAAACPVCDGTLEPTPLGGRCRDCGSRLR